jgi:hypothetical protein
LKDDYDFNAKTGNRTYKRFTTAWNLEVSRRFQSWSRDGEDVVLIRLKSEIFLRDYYKALREMQSLQSVIPQQQDEHRDQMTNQFRETRNALPVTAPPHVVVPVTYVNRTGFVPYGNPTVLNAEITMAAMHAMRNNNNAAPFRVGMPLLPAMAIPRTQRKIFRSKKWCIVCGWRKNQHADTEGKGGKDKRGNSYCKRDYCGNCYQLKEEHDKRNIGMGPECTLTTNQFCAANVQDWWEYKVRLDMLLSTFSSLNRQWPHCCLIAFARLFKQS